MAVRQFVTVGSGPRWRDHAALNMATTPVQAQMSDSSMDEVIRDLIDTMRFYPTCIGLAAPQIGYSSRVAVLRDEVVPEGRDLVIINPAILTYRGHRDGKNEACMSIPGWYGLVKRKLDIDLTFQDENGADQLLTATDFFARVIQHEVDHLDGILYPARMRADDELMEKSNSE